MSEIYQTELLKLAGRASGAGRLDAPDASATAHNPMCGDRITMDLRLDNGTVTDLGYAVRACLVCQASASLAGEGFRGQTVAGIDALRDAVDAYLKDAGPAPEGYAVFEPVRQHLSRHTCVLLPFDAVEKAASGED
ncbi:MAG: iron-sulfur cluster assembly scaffold protein [Pseudomonadota bacterium]|nr:iron-sulfur cluster assembly scaffold protein [Pseudomonadota bacterium]